jgi:heterodisulfide reductase subunit A
VGRKGQEDVAVIGGGIAGMKSALQLAALGRKVTLIEAGPSLGGKAVRGLSDDKFSKRDATLDNISTIMMDVEWNKSIKVMTLTTVTGAEKDEKTKGYKLKLLTKARHVSDACTSCQKCVDPCPVTVPNEYSEGVGTRKAVFLPNFYASPRFYVIDEKTCLWYKDKSCRRCEEVCPVDAIDFDADQKDATADLAVDAVVLAMGATTTSLSLYPQYGGGKAEAVITNAQAMRYLDPAGPTGGSLVLEGGKRPQTLAFVQAKGKGAWAEVGPVTLRWAADTIRAAAGDNPSVKVHLFHDKEAGASLKGQLIGLNRQLGVEMHDQEVTRIEQKGEGKVSVKWASEGGEQTLEVDLAVVATPIEPQDALKQVATMLGVKVDASGYAVPEGRVQVTGPARRPMTLDEVFDDAMATAGLLVTTFART